MHQAKLRSTTEESEKLTDTLPRVYRSVHELVVAGAARMSWAAPEAITDEAEPVGGENDPVSGRQPFPTSGVAMIVAPLTTTE